MTAAANIALLNRDRASVGKSAVRCQTHTEWATWRKEVTRNPPMLRLDGTVAFLEGWTLLVPAESGVYFIHDLRGFIYIGRTRNLNLRYRQHYWASHNQDLAAAIKAPVGQIEFSWITCDERVAIELERTYIHGFQPLANGIRFTTTDSKTPDKD
ncbi:MAG TPA: GIY-YIG nuclease family protein [Jatrophihabitans sp.]|nr:GIY-YIG nuclease family protein [Jatrophihabitans sp.]